MKHFIVTIHYDVELELIDSIVQDHRAFLQKGYEAGLILMSGPQNPRECGIVICRAPDQKVIDSFFELDPYNMNHFVHYDVLEFNPVKYQPMIKDWVVE